MKKIIEIIIAIIVIGMFAFIAYQSAPGVVEISSTSPMITTASDISLEDEQTELQETGFSEKEAEVLTEEEPNLMTTATFTTNKGVIEIELYDDLAPKTVENFTKLASSNFYDGVKFHRVIKGFMIQSGDPLSKDDSLEDRWGTGGPGYKFDDEIHAKNNNLAGTISMANAGPNTNGSQFFINVTNNDFLDTKHTVFGKVTKGMDVVTTIENVETLPGDRPVEAVIIESITIS